MSDFFIYKIRKGDFSNNITKRIGIHVADLKYFHNSICDVDANVYFDNLIGLQYLLIPINFKTEEEKLQNLINERPNSPFNKNTLNSLYQVKETINNFSMPETVISYDLSLTFLDDETKNIVSYKRNNFKKSNQIIDTKMSNLGLKTTQTIEPISLILKQNGTADSIYQANDLLLRFLDKKEKIQDFYIGVATEKYLEIFENNLKRKQHSLKQLLNLY